MQQRWTGRLVSITVLQTLGVALAVFILAWALVRWSGRLDRAGQIAPAAVPAVLSPR